MRRCVTSSSYFTKISTLYNNTFDTTQTILWFLSPFKLRYCNFLKVKHSWILLSPKTCSIKQVQTTGQTSKSYSFDSTVYNACVCLRTRHESTVLFKDPSTSPPYEISKAGKNFADLKSNITCNTVKPDYYSNEEVVKPLNQKKLTDLHSVNNVAHDGTCKVTLLNLSLHTQRPPDHFTYYRKWMHFM